MWFGVGKDALSEMRETQEDGKVFGRVESLWEGGNRLEVGGGWLSRS
jgi:hypothetical protein